MFLAIDRVSKFTHVEFHDKAGKMAGAAFLRTVVEVFPYPIAPNRLGRNFAAAAPNQVWLADLTYIPTGEGWLYLAAILAAILGMHARKLVGWSMREPKDGEARRCTPRSPWRR